MMRPIFLVFFVACFSIAAVPAQAQSARLQKCTSDKQVCYNRCTERAAPGEGTEVSCQGDCNRWFNACRGKGRGPVSRNKSKNRRR